MSQGEKNVIRVGYACQIAGLKGYTVKTCRMASATKEKLLEITHENLETLYAMLKYNFENGIRLFRISSDIIPFGSHPVRNDPWWEAEEKPLRKIGHFIRESCMRVSMHPGQYTVLNSKNEEVVENALSDLAYHNRFLDALGLPESHKIVLHIGGAYGDKKSALERFIKRVESIPNEIRQRLVVENDDKIFDIEDVLHVCDKLSLPAVFDLLHHQCNHEHQGGEDISSYLTLCAKTWKKTDGPQKIHYSQQREGAKCGVHAKTIRVDQWISDYKQFDQLDVMLEVKDKNLSAVKCDMIANGSTQRRLEQEWARYKYLIMRHSQAHYLELGKRFGEKSINVADFFRIVDEALETPPTASSVRNAAQHMWGYFKRKEKAAPFAALLERYVQGTRSEEALFSYLYRLAVKWEERYLLDGYSFASER